MKKVIAILTLVLVFAGVAFAATSETLTVNAKVKPLAPVFTMVGGEDTDYGTTATGTITSDKDIATTAIDIYVKITQDTKSIYKNKDGFDLTVTASALSATIEGISYSSAAPTIKASGKGTDITNAKDPNKKDLEITMGTSGSTVTYTLKYNTGAPVAASAAKEIGTAQFQWAKDDTLPVGDYSATITMTYTAN